MKSMLYLFLCVAAMHPPSNVPATAGALPQLGISVSFKFTNHCSLVQDPDPQASHLK